MNTILPALATGFAGGAFAAWLGTPIPWLLGSLLATAMVTLRGVELKKPAIGLERWMRVIVGVALGPSVAQQINGVGFDTLVAVAASLFSVLLLAMIGGKLFHRYYRMSPVEAFLCALPGGLSFMMALAGDEGNNRARIALVHTVRVVTLVLFVSFLAAMTDARTADTGWFSWFEIKPQWQLLWLVLLVAVCGLLAGLVPVAGSHVTVPMMLSTLAYASGIISVPAPQLISTCAMLTFGIVLGCELGDGPKSEYLKLAIGSIAYTAMAFILAAILALGISLATTTSFLTLLLAFAPGGIVEVSLIAMSLQLDVGLVAIVHLARFLAIMLIGPLVLRWIKTRIAVRQAGHREL